MKDNNNSLAVPNLHIPPEAVEPVADEFADAMQCSKICERNLRSLKGVPCECGNRATAAIRAALAAWPGMTTEPRMWRTAIILPLTEPRDE